MAEPGGASGPQLPFLPLRGGVLLAPTMARPFALGRRDSIAAAGSAPLGERLVFASTRDPDGSMTGAASVFGTGVTATLVESQELSEGVVRIFVEAVQRVRLKSFAKQPEGFFRVSIEPWEDAPSNDAEVRALYDHAIERFGALRRRAGLPAVAEKLVWAGARPDHPLGFRALPWVTLSYLGKDAPAHWIPIERRQALLEAPSLSHRLGMLIQLLDEADPPASLANEMTPFILRAADAAGLA